MQFDLAACRREFPSFARIQDGRPVVYLDGPAGSQVPRRVAEAMSDYLFNHNANHGGAFATSRQSDALTIEARRAVADLLGVVDDVPIVFGANMTTLTFAFSRALAREWKPGDEVVVTRLDHDANITPWVLAARDAGATLKQVRFHPENGTLDLNDFRAKLSARTRLVAVGAASNSLGTVNPVAKITAIAHEVGAEVFVDAVHYAPHRLIDVPAWGCDYLVCSAYKFFGPHVGILWGRRDRLERLTPYKVRPASDDVPDRWMTGTPNLEGIAGVRAAIGYLADLDGPATTRREALVRSFQRIDEYERRIGSRLLQGLASVPGLRIYGINDPSRWDDRVPTVSFTMAARAPHEIGERLAARAIQVWSGNFYAMALSEDLGLEPEGMVRVGLLHYNTAGEVDELIAALEEMA
jgi:cysteine desulfurase family protein (TIGR01976 family)